MIKGTHVVTFWRGPSGGTYVLTSVPDTVMIDQNIVNGF